MGVFLREHPHFFSGKCMTCVEDVLNWLNDYAPFRYMENWDRCGLQVGDPNALLNRVLVGLDPSSKTIEEAEKIQCQCLVVHHPLIFHPLKALREDEFPGNLVMRSVRSGLHIIAAHTNLDAAKGGTNDYFARLLGLASLEPLEVDPRWKAESLYGGMGRIGFPVLPLSLEELAEMAATNLGISDVRVVGEPSGQVRKVAVCTGSGGSLMEGVIRAGCDVYVTGDIRYHEAQRAVEAGLSLIDVGHFASERLIVPSLAGYLRSRAQDHDSSLEIYEASMERDPFWVHRGLAVMKK